MYLFFVETVLDRVNGSHTTQTRFQRHICAKTEPPIPGIPLKTCEKCVIHSISQSNKHTYTQTQHTQIPIIENCSAMIAHYAFAGLE